MSPSNLDSALRRRVVRRGEVPVPLPVDEAFSLFTALGEREWVEGWEPEVVWPAGGDLEEDQVWITRQDGAETLWAVARLQRDRHAVEYLRFRPSLDVARVSVDCRPQPDGAVAEVTYTYTALSPEGERCLEALTEEAYGERMRSWERAIREALDRR
jgi:hypothetical protein